MQALAEVAALSTRKIEGGGGGGSKQIVAVVCKSCIFTMINHMLHFVNRNVG